ncbi:MAG: peptidase zinc-dependent, partial [Epsilonproteobacteria bacterium]|nr:peptidase zinc-dependent [Campylobacterota bacterium]NPA64221.1 peptidase zinc-dependent [Campylobacterota bacterium]
MVVGYEWYDEEVLAFLTTSVAEEIGLTVKFWGEIQLPKEAFNTLRKQYLASILVERLLQVPRTQNDLILGITNEDLYEPDLNFVFGLASPLLSVGVIGLKRLHNSFYGLP